jgi:uncharacterized tellurite resistance protein B-like protein
MAQADGDVSGSELALIYKIVMDKSLPMFEVEQLIQNPPQEQEELEELSKDERFEYLYALVLMMKMDAKLDPREEELCQSYAESLGYDPKVIPELLGLIKSDLSSSDDNKALKDAAQKFLK